MPAIPAVDPAADFQFVSRSAGNTPEKIQAALEAEGIFVKDISEQSDAPVEKPAEEEAPVVTEPSSEKKVETPAVEEPKPGESAAKAPDPKPEAQAAEEPHKKAAPGVKERQKQKIGELTSKLSTVEAEAQTERQKREQLERELADLRAGKSTPEPDPARTPTTVVKTEEKPAEPAKPRPVRPKLPEEKDFWEEEDPTAAFKAAQIKHETLIEKYDDDLADWRLDERERVRRETEQSERQKEATESFQAQTQAEQKSRADRYKEQAAAITVEHPDYQEKLTAAKPFSAAMIEAAHAMDRTAEIAYWLASNPEEAERITKVTELPAKPTQGQINKAMRLTFKEFEAIEAKIAAAVPADDPDDEEETPPVAAAPAGKVAAPEAAPPAAPAPKQAPKKFTPVTPVGGRGGKSNKTIAELQASNDKDDMEEYRKLSLDEIRRRKANGT